MKIEEVPNINLENIFIRKATTREDLDKVFRTRWEGYGQYYKNFSKTSDQYDKAPNCTLLLAVDKKDTPLGTIRILDSTSGEIELNSFLDINNFITDEETPYIEATRFTVIAPENRFSVKIALWKAIFLYCRNRKIPTILISSIFPISKDYEFLLFEDVGDSGIYSHSVLGGKEHRSFKLNIAKAEEKFKEIEHPLYKFFILEEHLNIKYK